MDVESGANVCRADSIEKLRAHIVADAEKMEANISSNIFEAVFTVTCVNEINFFVAKLRTATFVLFADKIDEKKFIGFTFLIDLKWILTFYFIFHFLMILLKYFR